MANQYNEYYNSYIEIMVKKQKTVREYVKIVLIILLTVLLLWFFVASFVAVRSIFSLLLAALTVYFASLLMALQNVEYEYNFTMGELDIAAIYSKKRRGRVVNIKCIYMEEFEELRGETVRSLKQRVNGKMIRALSQRPDARIYYILFGREGQINALLFEPDDAMISAIQRQIQKNRAVRGI